MIPIDPKKPIYREDPSPPAPPYLDDDDPTLDSVEEGLDLAEDDTRNMAFGDSEEPAPSVEDVSYDNEEGISPEVDAIHEEKPPRSGKEK